MTFNSIISYIASRLKEPSTWAGISAGMLFLHVNLDPGLMSAITTFGTALGALLAFMIPSPQNTVIIEKKVP